MNKEVFKRADKLNHFLEAYQDVIKLYCGWTNGCNYSQMANALKDIDAINPEFAKDIRKSVQKAYDDIQKEFDEL